MGDTQNAQRVVTILSSWGTYVTCMWQVDWPEPGSSWWFLPRATPQGRWSPPAVPQTLARNLWLRLPTTNKRDQGKQQEAGSDLQAGNIKVQQLRICLAVLGQFHQKWDSRVQIVRQKKQKHIDYRLWDCLCEDLPFNISAWFVVFTDADTAIDLKILVVALTNLILEFTHTLFQACYSVLRPCLIPNHKITLIMAETFICCQWIWYCYRLIQILELEMLTRLSIIQTPFILHVSSSVKQLHWQIQGEESPWWKSLSRFNLPFTPSTHMYN